LTLNGLANRRLQPLGHISAEPYKAKNHSNRRLRIVKVRRPLFSPGNRHECEVVSRQPAFHEGMQFLPA
jgi:hypothetical protein